MKYCRLFDKDKADNYNYLLYVSMAIFDILPLYYNGNLLLAALIINGIYNVINYNRLMVGNSIIALFIMLYTMG